MPIDRGVVDQQLQALGDSLRWWDQRELRDLPAVLHEGEQIIAISRGKVARVRWLRRSWLIVVTDRRLLCLRSAGKTSWRQLEVPANRISRVALRIGLFRGRVLVTAGSQTYRLLVPRPDAYKLLTALSTLVTPSNEALPGFGPTRVIRRVMDHVLALPAAALDPDGTVPPPPAALDTSVTDRRLNALEEEVRELRQQVDFLEQLLRERHPSLIPGEDILR